MGSSVILLMTILCCLIASANSLWLHHENSTFGDPVFMSSPRMVFLGPSNIPSGGYNEHPIYGQLIYTEEKHPSFNLSGVVLIYKLHSGQSQEDAAEILKDSGVSGVITIFRANSDYPGAGNWVRSGKLPHQPFPLFEISSKQNDTLDGWFKNSTQVMVTIGDDANPWDDSFRYGLPTIAYFLLIFNGVIAIISAYKLVLILTVHGFRASVAQVVFWLNLVGACIRIAWGSSDPFGCWGTTPFVWTQLGLTLSFPFAIGGALVIALYWHELIKRSGPKINLFLDKMLIPFLAFGAFMVVFELVTGCIRGFFIQFAVLVFIVGAIYVIVVLAVLIFFVVTRYRLQKVFEKLNKDLNRTKKGQRLSLATTQIAIMVAAMIIWVLCLVIIGAFDVVWNPVAFPILWAILLTALATLCLLQVLVVRAPTRSWKWIFCGVFSKHPDVYLSATQPTASYSSNQVPSKSELSSASSAQM